MQDIRSQHDLVLNRKAHLYVGLMLVISVVLESKPMVGLRVLHPYPHYSKTVSDLLHLSRKAMWDKNTGDQRV